MAAGTVSYEAPQYGSLAGTIGEKIGSALTMAAGARRRRDQEIEKLNNKEDKTDEEKQRLKDLQSQGFGFIAKKALGTEFGGDLRRRTKGFFQMNPEDQNDPALDKKKRFEALLRAEPTGIQRTPDAPPDKPVETRQDSSILGSFATDIVEKISLLSKKVDDLKNTEAADKTQTTVVKLSENFRNIKSFFSKNNSIEEESVKIARESLSDQKKAADQAEAREIETRGESRDRKAGTSSIDNVRDFLSGKKGGDGLLGTVLDVADVGLDLIGLRKGKRRRNRRKGNGLSTRRNPNVQGQTAYSSPIGPQPMNSATPWAAKGPGDRGGIFGQSGFTPRLPSRKLASGGVIGAVKYPSNISSNVKSPEKLASGAVLDNPTSVGGESAVVPKNQMATAVKQDSGNAKKAPLFAKIMDIPTIAAGGLMLARIGNIVNNMGGIGKIFRPVLKKLFSVAAPALGIPVNLISAFFGGGAAQASMMVGPPGKGRGNGKTGTGNAVNANTGGNTSGIGPAGMITNGGSVGQYRSTRGYGMQTHPISGDQKMHWGIDYAIPEGEPIAVKKGGKVIEVAPPTTGTEVSGIVSVRHDDGTESRYVHLSSVNVSNGDLVYPGTMIGKVGGVPGNPGGGGSTGAHLHWEYYRSAGQPADGAGLAESYFTVGGQITSPSQPAIPQVNNQFQNPAAPPAAPLPVSPQASSNPLVLPPIFQSSPPPASPLQPINLRNNLYNFNPESPYQPSTIW